MKVSEGITSEASVLTDDPVTVQVNQNEEDFEEVKDFVRIREVSSIYISDGVPNYYQNNLERNLKNLACLVNSAFFRVEAIFKEVVQVDGTLIKKDKVEISLPGMDVSENHVPSGIFILKGSIVLVSEVLKVRTARIF